MATKISRKTFLKGSFAGLGMMALSGVTAGAAVPAEEENCISTLANKPASVHTEQKPASGNGWQVDRTFPNWAGYADDSLAMNTMYTFTGFEDQGTIYITPAEGVTGFQLFVNNREIKTGALTGGATWAVDISKYTVNGDNTIQISNVRPRGEKVAVKIAYPTVLDGRPEEVGLNPDVLETISQIIQSDVDNGFPSAQMAVIKDGKLVYQNAWGKLNSYNPDGSVKTDSPMVTNETMYDLASNSKMYSVNYALQYLLTNGKLSLDEKLVDLFGEEFAEDTIDITYTTSVAYKGYENKGLELNKQWKRTLTIRDLLRHQAGFPASTKNYNDNYSLGTSDVVSDVKNVLYTGSDGSEATRENTLKIIFKTPLMYEPGTKTVYSDIDYMLMGFIVEKVTGKRLDAFLRETFWEPMGLTRITYKPLENGFTAEDCAATELNGNTRDGAINFSHIRHYTLQGEVHDEKAYYTMAGVSGHAGLFASATELAKLASVMLTGGYGENKFFSRNVMDTFIAPKKEDAATWGLGWWREGDDGRCWYFGTQSSSATIGHTGWTGTLTMIDPVENLVLVYLTNKINSPVTDPAASTSKFNGNWYTSSTHGFVAQLLYQGLENRAPADANAVMSAILSDMVEGKFSLVDKQKTDDANHPIVRAGYAVLEAMVARAKTTHSRQDWANVKEALELLDPSRDAEELAKLQKICAKH